MPNEFFSPEGDIENYFVTEYWLIDQYIGDQLWTWGNGTTGRLGTNNTLSRSTPVTTFAGGTNWKQVSAGNFHTAAVKTNGTLWTWGNGNFGRLGNNATTQRNTPIQTSFATTNWKQVSAGDSHTAAIKTDGTLWTWGSGGSGQLGTNNTTPNRLTPVTTFAGGTNWKQVNTGPSHTAAVKTNGTLWTWGNGSFGRLGTNNTLSRSTPVTTFAGGTNWKQVSSGTDHTAAIKTDGTLWTWGLGTSGQLGNNQTITNIVTPVTTFAGGTNWKQVSCGLSYTAAIKTDGTLWTWGVGTNGRLGTNNTLQRLTPVTTFAGGTNWKQVSAGKISTTAAIKTDGTLWTWGNGVIGIIGNNATTDRLTPVTTFAGGNNWKQVSPGGNHTTAVQSGIELYTP